MSSKVEYTKSCDEDFSCGLLLRDIEEISKALYLHKSPQDAFNASYDHPRNVAAKNGISESKSNVIIRDLHKDKKSSIWNWKPIKALTHTRNHRLNCCFFLHVHAIEGLPPYFNNLKLCVTWKRKTDILRTRPAQVCLGMAEFEETLMHRCSIYVGRTGPHGSANYDPKLFLLNASVIGAPTLDIGSRWLDLTRLLPLTLDELAGDKSSSGKWTTSFKLSGKAKGATLNVSFGFSIFDDSSVEPGYFAKVPDIAKEGGLDHFADCDSRTNQLHNLGSVPMSLGGPYQQSHLKLFDEMFPKHLEFWKPMSDLSSESESVSGQTRYEFDDTEFDVIEQGIEVSVKDQIKPENCSSQRFDSSVIETIDVAEIFKGEETDFVEYVEWNSKLDVDNHDEYECAADDPKHRDDSMYVTEPSFEELDSSFCDMLTSKPSNLDSLLDKSIYNEYGNYMRSESRNRSQRLRRSLSLDDLVLAESIENDFLNMLIVDENQEDMVSGSGHDMPRDLLKLCEEDPIAWGSSILDADLMAEKEVPCSSPPKGYAKVAFAVDLDLSFPFQAAERNHHALNQSFRNKRNAEMLENLETEALMDQWGLTEKAFQYSPRATSGGFGSPVYLPTEEPLQLPPVVEGKGPIVRIKDGGFLRSMNPLLFRNANNGARLIVQVSAPVVLPPAMGSMTLEMLRCWACVGIEKMCFQANELMPLEDVTGKTIQQVLAEAESGLDASYRWAARYSCSNAEQIDSDYVSIEDLVPMAITNIEGLLVEGLKIQSGMPNQEPPSSIGVQLAGNSTSPRKASELSNITSSERASDLPIQDVDEIIKYSLSLEEWLRLDTGQLYVEDDNHENMSRLFAAHCAKPVELGSEWLKRDDETMKLPDKSGGSFGDNFRMGLKVQLRDPLRNHEMVGSPMLALVQVNRVSSPLQPELIERGDGQTEHMILEGADSEQNRKNICQPMFKVSEVHLAGFNVARLGNKPFWGTSRQCQSGSRWLLSSGMARSKKNHVSNSTVVIRSSSGFVKKAQVEDVLWSISLPIEGEAATWDERIALNVHVRNPDIVFP
ncbi:hypothetical protein C2S53_009295 [Perilla frutescens var. hirtella]|uniref:C2 NT-type domain-containing protein n=1 Tax=Perilla frutescens var. hirtella TaxID=608512 RepID=A0AAD4P9N8_PERFH|nr:hypothetical protein C2S53_009295 [Perilla frutescens var. hirtella]